MTEGAIHIDEIRDCHFAFSKKFLGKVMEYYRTLRKIRESFGESVILAQRIKSMEMEYGCDQCLEKEPNDDLVKNFLKNEWCYLQSLMAMYISAKYYQAKDFSFVDFINFRDLMEVIMNEAGADISAYSRIINFFNIPVVLIPKTYLMKLQSADEFVSASHIIQRFISDKVEEPDSFETIDEYRNHSNEMAKKVIARLHGKHYFGTYETTYLAELIMCYKLGFPMVGALYITKDIPKNNTDYNVLKKTVNNLWITNRENFNGNG